MDKKTCIDILTRHNAWRRDDNIPNSYEMVNPTELGLAIDYAVKFLEAHQRVDEIKREWARNKREELRKDPEKLLAFKLKDSEKRRKRYREDEEYRQRVKDRSHRYYHSHKAEVKERAALRRG